MSYYEELTGNLPDFAQGSAIIDQGVCRKACAEVDRLRVALAASRDEAEKAKALPADLGTWTSTIRWMLNVSEDRPYTQAATLFDKVGDTNGVPHRGHLEALWSWLDELGGRQSGATGTPTYKIPYEIRNSMEHLQAKLQRTIDRELDRQAKPAARADAARKEPPAKAHGCEVGE